MPAVPAKRAEKYSLRCKWRAGSARRGATKLSGELPGRDVYAVKSAAVCCTYGWIMSPHEDDSKPESALYLLDLNVLPSLIHSFAIYSFSLFKGPVFLLRMSKLV